jgi:hypothetical protein
MYRFEQANPHHLSNTARIMPIGLVDLLRLEQRLHVPRLDADHRQTRFRYAVHKPLRQWTRFDPDAPVVHTL